jgi:hypothetical protein
MSTDDKLSRLDALVQDHERRIKLLEQRLSERDAGTEKVASPAASKVPTIRQFIVGKNPTDDVQRSLTIGYYLEKHANHGSFSAKDLEKGFVDAREKVPSNVADKILKNVWKGHMMQAQEEKDGLKAYVLTNAGTKFVDNGFKQKDP